MISWNVLWHGLPWDSPAMTGALGALESRRNWLELSGADPAVNETDPAEWFHGRSCRSHSGFKRFYIILKFYNMFFWAFPAVESCLENSEFIFVHETTAFCHFSVSWYPISWTEESHCGNLRGQISRPIQNPSGVCGMEWHWCCCTHWISLDTFFKQNYASLSYFGLLGFLWSWVVWYTDILCLIHFDGVFCYFSAAVWVQGGRFLTWWSQSLRPYPRSLAPVLRSRAAPGHGFGIFDLGPWPPPPPSPASATWTSTGTGTVPCDVAAPSKQPEEAIMVHMVHSVTQAPEVQEVPRDAKNRKPWKMPGFTMFNPTSC